MTNFKNNTGRRGLNDNEIDLIRKTYKEVSSIVKAAQITGYSCNSVNKYCLDLTSKSKHSRNNNRKVLLIKKDGSTKVFRNAHVASKETELNYTGIIQVLNGKLEHIGGCKFKLI